jgi:hypothetical protein
MKVTVNKETGEIWKDSEKLNDTEKSASKLSISLEKSGMGLLISTKDGDIEADIDSAKNTNVRLKYSGRAEESLRENDESGKVE